jgi:hypothetical protein
MILNAWSADRRNEPYAHTGLPLLAAGAGFAALGLVHAPIAAMVAYLAAMAPYYAAIGTFWLAPNDMVHLRARAVTFAAVNGVGQLGSFLFPWLWGVAKDATGSYQLGLTLLPLAFATSGLIMLGLQMARRRRVAAAPA